MNGRLRAANTAKVTPSGASVRAQACDGADGGGPDQAGDDGDDQRVAVAVRLRSRCSAWSLPVCV